MAWRAARSLLVLHRQLKTGSRAAPPATGADEWGLIGDAAHDPTSDHTPHDFPGWGSQIVTAADFPNRPDLGLDAHKVLDDIRRNHDPRAKYGISNGQIFSNHAVGSYGAWVWRPYDGSDKHFTHGHLSVVGDQRADGEQPWATIGGVADVNLSDKVPGTGTALNGNVDRTVGDILHDEARLRAVLIGELSPQAAGFAAGSPLGQLLAPRPVTLTDADLDVLAGKVAAKLAALRFVPDES